ncbi:MAG: homoserine/homoserine lactone efflux protein [Oleiphilaceae bacterium]|jgi:homoserine/homoserine lactone efflux protein
MINDYLLYVTLAIAVTAIPGPAVVLTIRNSLRYGYKVSMANIIGNFAAMVIIATFSALGIGTIIMTSAVLFSCLKTIGCLYLFYLGIKVWRSSDLMENAQTPVQPSNRRMLGSVFKEGFGVGISNPKAIVFFTALFPQFIDISRPYIPQFLTLILTIECVSFLILTSYALLSSVAAPYIYKKSTMSMFNKLTGAAFFGFGAALIYEK